MNAGNYQVARRRFADGTLRPLWRDWCGALETVVNKPADAQLWYDATDIAFLQEDEQDAANIRAADATAIRTLTDGGYQPDSVIEAVTTTDMSRLTHTGLLPVQVQEPGSNQNGE